MERTCGEPNEIKRNAHPKNVTARFSNHVPLGEELACLLVRHELLHELVLLGLARVTVVCGNMHAGFGMEGLTMQSGWRRRDVTCTQVGRQRGNDTERVLSW